MKTSLFSPYCLLATTRPFKTAFRRLYHCTLSNYARAMASVIFDKRQTARVREEYLADFNERLQKTAAELQSATQPQNETP